MSGFGNFLAGAVGGGGQAVASIASKYIDEGLAQQRAQALADIQHANMVRGEEYMQSAPVQERRRGNERSLLEMRRDVDLQSKVAEASNPELRQARIDNENAFTEGTAGTKLDAERTRRLVLDPMDVERERALTRVRGDEQIRVNDAAQEALERRQNALKTAFERLPEAKKLEAQQAAAELKDINKAIVEAQAGGTWDAAKNPGQKQLAVTKAALEQRLRTILAGGEDDALGLFSSPKPGGSAAPAPAQSPAAPAQRPQSAVSAPAASAEPSEPGFMSKALAWFSETGRDYDNPEGKAELRRRVAEAGSGGTPLTRVERLRAQQLGLMNS